MEQSSTCALLLAALWKLLQDVVELPWLHANFVAPLARVDLPEAAQIIQRACLEDQPAADILWQARRLAKAGAAVLQVFRVTWQRRKYRRAPSQKCHGNH